MDQELISKKELLETFGISYGALYRWKRMGLIPEAWFLRRSTSTGQETFFRRDQICQRVRLILDNKEHQTLDELAASLAEKRQTVMARRKLIIETAYGRREFPLEEVRRAVVAEGQRRLRNRRIPMSFRGLPITLLYLGMLALAIYGFTGHSVIL